jgi:hypothetical protein
MCPSTPAHNKNAYKTRIYEMLDFTGVQVIGACQFPPYVKNGMGPSVNLLFKPIKADA